MRKADDAIAKEAAGQASSGDGASDGSGRSLKAEAQQATSRVQVAHVPGVERGQISSFPSTGSPVADEAAGLLAMGWNFNPMNLMATSSAAALEGAEGAAKDLARATGGSDSDIDAIMLGGGLSSWEMAEAAKSVEAGISAFVHVDMVNLGSSLGANGGGSTKGPAQAAVPVATDRAYSVVVEVQLEARGIGTRKSHFAQANEQLLRSEPELAEGLKSTMGPHWESLALDESGAVSTSSPPGFTWHHHPDREGVLQLVPFDQHKPGSSWQPLLHPDNRGGQAKWGKKY